MTMVVNPIYNNLLDLTLNSTEEELRQGHTEIDFSIAEKTWVDTLQSVAVLILKIVLFPWGLYEAIRWCFQRIVMTLQYPAQSWLVKNCCNGGYFKTENIDQRRENVGNRFNIVRHVTLEKDGIRSSGLLIGSPDTINNGKWVLQVVGNAATAEGSVFFAERYQSIGYNTLLVNNPGVGRSEGLATPESILECQKTAIAYLETALKAHRIVMAGYSLGGFSLEAINQSVEKGSPTNFLAVWQMTFAKASDMASMMASRLCMPGWLTKLLVLWTGCEMDNVESSKKLAAHGIREIILQGDRDWVIPYEYSLMNGLGEARALGNKVCQILPDTDHNSTEEVVNKTIEQITAWERELGDIIEEAQ